MSVGMCVFKVVCINWGGGGMLQSCHGCSVQMSEILHTST